MKSHFFGLIYFLLFNCCSAQQQTSEEAISKEIVLSKEDKVFVNKVDSLIRFTMDSARILPGLSIAIVKGDKIVMNKGYGFSDINTREKVTNRTMFYIGSATKSYIGLLAAILHEKKLFSLNTTLQKAFPNVIFHDSIDAEHITMRHLLSHTSSVNNGPLTYRLAYTGQVSETMLNDLIKYSVPNGKKIGEYIYDNTGYNIYTIALKSNTGIDWKDALKKYVFDVLGMKQTTAYFSDIARRSLQFALPYAPLTKPVRSSMVPLYLHKTDATMHSAGGIVSNSTDLANWLLIHLNQGNLNGKQKIDTAIITLNHTGIANLGFTKSTQKPISYTLGWNKIGTVHDSTEILYHYGYYPGYRTNVFMSPKQKIGVAICSNSMYGEFVISNLERYVLDYFKDSIKADTLFTARFAESMSNINIINNNYLLDRENRNGRKWTLDLSKDYNGIYSHESYGTINVLQNGKKLFLKYGNLEANADPYTEPNSLRVEFLPLNGESITFTFDDLGRIIGLVYRDRLYRKE